MSSEPEPPISSVGRRRDFAISLLVMLAVLASVDIAYRVSPFSESIDKGMHLQSKRTVFEAGKKHDIVVTGSSVVGEGLAPDAVSARIQAVTGRNLTTFNFGTPAGSFVAAAIIADAIIARPASLRPSFYVITFSPMEFSCCPQLEVPSNVKYSAAIRLGDIWPLAAAAPAFDERCAVVSLGASRLLATRAAVRRALLDFQPPDGPITFPDNGGGGGFGAVDPATQDVRAHGRMVAYRPTMMKPHTVDREFTYAYFRSMVTRLRAAGVDVALVGGPQARQLDEIDGPDSIYPEYAAFAEEMGRELGTGFVNMRSIEGITNADFVDGDHLNSEGARKFGAALADLVVIPMVRRRMGADIGPPPAAPQ